MLRKTMLALAALAVLGFGLAQVTVNPSVGTGDDQIAKGETSADVDQTVELILPQATALHLAANTITFNLEYLDGDYWEDRANGVTNDADTFAPTYACVYVAGDDGELDDVFFGQTQVVPGLVAYEPTTWDAALGGIIKLGYVNPTSFAWSRDANEDDRVVTYPPIRLDENGLVVGSKDYFVCYQTFVIQLFSNFDMFDLQVERTDANKDTSIEHLYVQGNTCSDFGDATGLYDLPDGAMRHLLPTGNLTAGPTGTLVNIEGSKCPNSNTSWLDVLGVLAVKINADHHGTSIADLTYTLISSDNTFTATTTE